MKKRPIVKENTPNAWSIPPLKREDSKYTRGHVAILGGNEMTGAARLAALAAQRAGAGLVTIAATKASWPVYAASLMSVITRTCDAAGWKTLMGDARVNPVLIGPGSGMDTRVKNAQLAAAKTGKTLILDADALSLLASDVALRKALQKSPKILTPHEGEYARLAKALKLDATLPKPARAAALAQALNAVVVLKGADTLIADGRNILKSQPPHWLATGGTGDVLAGIIAALVGQGMGLFEAAAAGVWLHAETAETCGPGMIAEDLIAGLPMVLSELH